MTYLRAQIIYQKWHSFISIKFLFRNNLHFFLLFFFLRSEWGNEEIWDVLLALLCPQAGIHWGTLSFSWMTVQDSLNAQWISSFDSLGDVELRVWKRLDLGQLVQNSTAHHSACIDKISHLQFNKENILLCKDNYSVQGTMCRMEGTKRLYLTTDLIFAFHQLSPFFFPLISGSCWKCLF